LCNKPNVYAVGSELIQTRIFGRLFALGFGITATMGEMLLQSQVNKMELLPALPDAWKNERVSGLRARRISSGHRLAG
jgi:hypothetical protein